MNNENYLHNLIKVGLSLIPITEGKKNPHYILGGKHTLLDVQSTHEELNKWISAGVKSWGLANGVVSKNLVTLDFDEKNFEGLFDLFYQKLSDEQKEIMNTCAINKTRNNGTHVRYFTETPQSTTKLSRRLIGDKIETTSEVRGQGAYALIPPSDGYVFTQGDLLHIPQVTDDMHKQFTDIMRTFDEVKEEPIVEYSNIATVQGNRPGDIFNLIASWTDILTPFGWIEDYKDHWRRPGKGSNEGISATTNYEGRSLFYVFSTSVYPFNENTGYSKFHVYTLLNHNGDFKASAKRLYEDQNQNQLENSETKKGNMADNLIDIINQQNNVVLFHNEQMDPYISVRIGDHQEIMSMKSKTLRRWITKVFWDKHNKTINSDSIKTAIGLLEGKACFEGDTYKLHQRIAWKDDNLVYDLNDKKWQGIEISKDGWNVISELPILFDRYSHSRSQVMPSDKDGDVSLIFKYVNISKEEHKLLLLIYLISCFIPDFPHPILIIFGAQGSAKSTLSKILRHIVDPSQIEVASMPEKHADLVQALAHNTFLFFDNVSHISTHTSDILCKAITGSGFLKRELYTDDEDIIYRFKRCIGINSINLVSTKPDLLDRSILLELERIEDSKRKQENEIKEEFEKDLPFILGGVFDVLSKVLQIKPNIKLSSYPRMADFALWGSAIAEAIGYSKEDFILAYQNNIDTQKDTVLNDNLIAIVLISFMEKREWKKWSGTMTELLEKLTWHADVTGINTRDKYWPKAPNTLSRAINVLKTTMESAGIFIVNLTDESSRRIIIEKISQEEKEPENEILKNGSLLKNDTTIPTIEK